MYTAYCVFMVKKNQNYDRGVGIRVLYTDISRILIQSQTIILWLT